MYYALDIGGTNIKSAYIDEEGRIVQKFSPVKTPQTMSDLYDKLAELIAKATETQAVKGIPISSAGIINEQTREIAYCGSMLFLNGHNLPQFVEDQFQLRSSIINDGHAATLGESWLGELQNIEQGALMTLGTAVGCGLIINGSLYLGANNMAGELSFIYPNADHSLVWDDCSSVYFFREAAKFSTLNRSAEEITGQDIFTELIAGHNDALTQLFITYCERVARLIYNVQMVLDYEVVAIGGGISAEPFFIAELQQQYQQICDRYMSQLAFFRPVRITACKLQNDANLIGALHHFLKQA